MALERLPSEYDSHVSQFKKLTQLFIRINGQFGDFLSNAQSNVNEHRLLLLKVGF